jgi:hypothetical protein
MSDATFGLVASTLNSALGTLRPLARRHSLHIVADILNSDRFGETGPENILALFTSVDLLRAIQPGFSARAYVLLGSIKDLSSVAGSLVVLDSRSEKVAGGADVYLYHPEAADLTPLAALLEKSKLPYQPPTLTAGGSKNHLADLVVKATGNGQTTVIGTLISVTYDLKPEQRAKLRGVVGKFIATPRRATTKKKAFDLAASVDAEILRRDIRACGVDEANAETLSKLLTTNDYHAATTQKAAAVPAWTSDFEIRYLRDMAKKKGA